MKSITFTLNRTRCTASAQSIIALIWVWIGKTVAQWDASLLALESKMVALSDSEAEMEVNRGSLDADLADLHNKTLVWGTFFKLAYRNDPDNANVVKSLKASGGSRADIMEEATSLGSMWEKINPAWEPEAGQTLALFTTFREACAAKLYAYEKAKVGWRSTAEALNRMADVLDDECIAWYAAATVRFPEGTAEGDMIRGTVPTTTEFTPYPEQALVVVNEPPGPGAYSVSLEAEHATKFDVYQKGPGETEFTKVGVDVPPGLYVKTGLAAGGYEVKGQGRNSRGAGPESEPAGITVT